MASGACIARLVHDGEWVPSQVAFLEGGWDGLCYMHAGVLWDSAAVRLQHMCDAVIALEAVRDDSGISRMVSDGSRCLPALLSTLHIRSRMSISSRSSLSFAQTSAAISPVGHSEHAMHLARHRCLVSQMALK